jgi:hypothetical protein
MRSAITGLISRAADGVEHDVYALAGEVANALDQILAAVVERRGSIWGHVVVVDPGRCVVPL